MRQLFTNLCSALLVGTVALGTTASAQFVEKAGNRSGHSSPSRAVLTVENEKTADLAAFTRINLPLIQSFLSLLLFE